MFSEMEPGPNAHVLSWLSSLSPSLAGNQHARPLAQSFLGGGISHFRADPTAQSTRGKCYLSGDLSAPSSWGVRHQLNGQLKWIQSHGNLDKT